MLVRLCNSLKKRRLLWPLGVSLLAGLPSFLLAKFLQVPSPGLAAAGLWFLIALLAIAPRLQAAPLSLRGDQTDSKDWIEADTKARQTLVQIVGGLVLLLGAYSAWKQFENQRQQVEVQKAQADEQRRQFQLQFENQQRLAEEQRKDAQQQREAERARDQEARRRFQLQLEKERTLAEERRNEFRLQYEAARSEQVGQRFARAVDQLGNERAEIRIAAVRTLDAMVGEQPDLEWSIQDVLAAWIRRTVPRGQATTNQQFDDLIRGRRPFRPPAEIQRALTLLASRTWTAPVAEPRRVEGEDDWKFRDRVHMYRLVFRINLSGTDLRGAFLNDAKFDGVDLSGSDLVGVSFSRSSFRAATLVDCDARMAEFAPSNFDGADLSRTDFTDAGMVRSTFHGAILRGTILRGGFSITPKENFEGAFIDGTTVIYEHYRAYIEKKPLPSPAPRPGMSVTPRP